MQAEDKTNPDHKGEEDVAQGLDEALKEFDQEVSKTPEEQGEQLVVSKDDIEYLRARRAEDERTANNKDIESAIKSISDGIEGQPKYVFRGFMEEKAGSDPRVIKAWNARHEKPEEWKKVLKALNKELKEELSIDTKVTRDVQSLESAVRSASSHSADKPVNLNQMSDTQFALYKAGLGG